MKKNQNSRDAFKKQKAINKLADDLAEVNRRASPLSAGDSEMLSLIVNDALVGIDISKRYPTFYKKLLNNSNLRQAFIDSLELIEKSKKNELVALPNASEKSLVFLADLPFQPKIMNLGKNKWKIRWQRTIEQLQAVFFPSELGLAYRSDQSLFEDAWFILLRGDVDLKGKSYSVLLECGIAEGVEDSLSAFLNLAVTLESTNEPPKFPIYATLVWGKYSETLEITEQGRVRFPDIPFAMTLDKQGQSITSDLSLTLETTS